MAKAKVDGLLGRKPRNVSGVTGIREINRIIRKQMRNIGNVASGAGMTKRETMTKLVRESMYLCTLTHSGPWKSKFYGKITDMRDAAKDEYSKTAHTANIQVKQGEVKGDYYDESYGDRKKVTVESKPSGV